MTSNDGNAVAIVLLVLAVTSLIGVGMLTQSRMDVKFATSYKSHTTAVNLADGAASLALARVSFTIGPNVRRPASPTLLNAIYGSQYVRQGGTPSGTNLWTEERSGLSWFSRGPSLTQRRWPAGNWAERDARWNVGRPRDPGNDVTPPVKRQAINRSAARPAHAD